MKLSDSDIKHIAIAGKGKDKTIHVHLEKGTTQVILNDRDIVKLASEYGLHVYRPEGRLT